MDAFFNFTLSRFEWLNYRHKDFTLFHPKCRPTDNTITFFPSTDFEDAIRNAISIGGDSDTIAAITGSLAEACYGIPRGPARSRRAALDAPLQVIVTAFETAFQASFHAVFMQVL